MIRLLEIFLFLAPLVLYVGWRLLMPRAELSPRMIAAVAVVLAVMFVLLVWFRQEDAKPANTVYVPSELRGGQVIPPRGAP